MRRIFTVFFGLTMTTLGGSSLLAADRAWHEGTIVAVEQQEKTTTYQHSDTSYSAEGKGKAKAESTTTTSELPTEVYKVFTISDGQKTYEARQGSTIWHPKSKAQPGDKVQFAVNGDSLYVRIEENKEVKMKILKSSLASVSNQK